MRQPLPVLAAAVVLLAAPALADDKTPTISIQGKGEVVAAPDTASVNTGVTTEGKTAREALDANTKAMTGLMAALKVAGIDAKDIQTSGFSVNPQYVYPDNNNGNATPPHIAGYTVQNAVTVKIRKLADLGDILDDIVTAGSNTINGVGFSVDDPAKLLDEARKAAFADAKAKAKIYADAADVGLGPVQSISENAGNPGMPQPVMFKAMAVADRAPVPVAPGQLTFDVDVSVVWAIRSGTP